MLLDVNIDHIAVLREARKINDPNPLDALGICKLSGADQITIHLREDRRHIHNNDAKAIIEQSSLPVNLECSINPDIIDKEDAKGLNNIEGSISFKDVTFKYEKGNKNVFYIRFAFIFHFCRPVRRGRSAFSRTRSADTRSVR